MATIPSVLAPSISSFTPQSQAPFFSNPISEVINPVTYATGARTLTYADILSAFIIQASGAAFNDTLPSATLLIPQIQGAVIGTCIFFTIRNTGTFTITVVAGAGGTANAGDTLTIATLNQRCFMLRVTAVGDAVGNGAAYTLYSLGALAY